MKDSVKVAFASGTPELNRQFIDALAGIYPDLPLYVVSEFAPHQGQWVPYHPRQGFLENYRRCRTRFRDKHIRLAAAVLVPRVPYRRMRLLALLLSPVGFLAFNENLNNFMLRPRSLRAIASHCLWRIRNAVRAQSLPGGLVYRMRELSRNRQLRKIEFAYGRARMFGLLSSAARALPLRRDLSSLSGLALENGISVVIPSRNGRELLQSLLPRLQRELTGIMSEVLVIDNGSDDGTAAWLHSCEPSVTVDEVPEPLSYSRAVNRGLARARYSRTMLLNNDMSLGPGFFAPLVQAFMEVPDLFCATAQIFFPPGVRREETGKAVLRQTEPTAFPVRYDDPLPGENCTYVLYGSGGCSLYDTAKLRALSGFSEVYDPAYVEDLDAGYRAWLQGWPTVFVAGAQVEHRHRATTSRYYSLEQLERMLEQNYLRFLSRSVISARVFRTLWRQAVDRLRLLALRGNTQALHVLADPHRLPLVPVAAVSSGIDECLIGALVDGSAAVFPGRAGELTNRPTVLIASPFVPFPLAHGGAVRVFNLMRRAAQSFNLVLVAFSEQLEPPAPELLAFCREIALVRRIGSHARVGSARPSEVEAYDSAAFRAVLKQSIRKWQPDIVQLEMTQMAQYARDCGSARTVLVEHDITIDLYQQLVAESRDWDAMRELERWRRFETAAWLEVDRVVVMSEKDARRVSRGHPVTIPNGVDLERFRLSGAEPDPKRLLFIGSFQHLPNVLALEFFLSSVWPALRPLSPVLHVIAGKQHEFYLEHHQRMQLELAHPSIELEGFVADVRPAYERAAIVIAPLVASAGTNIKILEAMAMRKAIVSTPEGINGLDLRPDRDVRVAKTAGEMTAAIQDLIEYPEQHLAFEQQARQAARKYDWDSIAAGQWALYEELAKLTPSSATRAAR